MRRYGFFFRPTDQGFSAPSLHLREVCKNKMQTEVKCINRKKCTREKTPCIGFDYSKWSTAGLYMDA